MSVRILLSLLLIACTALPVVAQTEPAPATVPVPPATKTVRPPSQRPGPTILSIIPAQAEPGAIVTLTGSDFSERTVVHLGSTTVPAQVVDSSHLTFSLSDLQPGVYALYLRREDGGASRSYSFNVLPLRPVANDISPDAIPFCAAGREREVTVSGSNFRKGAQVLFDGTAVRTRVTSGETVIFTVPQLKGGLHQIQVKNTDDTVSGALGLLIDTRPEITTVSRGQDFVTAYNLIIEGRNFLQNSTLVVIEDRTLELTGQSSVADVRRLSSGTGGGSERERINYVNCSRIIYQRVPYSPTDKSFQIQVINPGGEESPAITVTAP